MALEPISPLVLWLLPEQALLDAAAVLLLAAPLVVDKEVHEVEGVMEQPLLHLLVQGSVRVEAGGVVYLGGEGGGDRVTAYRCSSPFPHLEEPGLQFSIKEYIKAKNLEASTASGVIGKTGAIVVL